MPAAAVAAAAAEAKLGGVEQRGSGLEAATAASKDRHAPIQRKMSKNGTYVGVVLFFFYLFVVCVALLL